MCAAVFYGCSRAGNVPAAITYDKSGKLVIESKGWNLEAKLNGQAPAVSPSANEVAFLRDGNLWLIARSGKQPKKITTGASICAADVFLPFRVSWHPSSKYVLYTRALPFEYYKPGNRLIPLSGKVDALDDVQYIMTIWIAYPASHNSRQVVGPMGDLTKLNATQQLEGASAYEPMFSPDGKWIWFLNAGSLFELQFNSDAPTFCGKPRLVAKVGAGLDFESSGASKWGTGAQQLAWDSKNNRLCYWIGRFWGSGESDFGYISWNRGKWGRPAKWHPKFAPDLKNSQFCGVAFDNAGNLWVNAFYKDQIRWVRSDAKVLLPPETGKPDWGPWR